MLFSEGLEILGRKSERLPDTQFFFTIASVF